MDINQEKFEIFPLMSKPKHNTINSSRSFKNADDNVY